MKILRLFLFAGLIGAALAAQDKPAPVDLRDPLPTVVLTDGRVLHDVKIISFGGSTVMAKWAGGQGTIAYAAFPDAIRQAAEARRSAAPQTPGPPGERCLT